MLDKFFEDLIIVELASVLAGPAVGMFFAELGAKVIKIENKKTGGDVTRKWKLPTENPDAEFSAYYHSVNYKKNIQLVDLQEDRGRDHVLKIIKSADIVVSNFRAKSAKKMGMDYESLKKINPALIYAELTGFGQEDRPAFDVVLQAEAGFLFMTGEPNREPVKMPVALIDLLAAHQLKEGILIALIHRMKTGQGSFVTTSLLEAAVASLANQANNWLMANFIPQRMGCMHPNIAPYGDIFYSKDNKPIVLAVGTERQFKNLCEVLKLEDLINDKRFEVNSSRVKNRMVLKEILALEFQKRDRDPLLIIFHNKSIPAGSIRNMKEVFDIPMAKEMILEEKLPSGEVTKRVKTVAFDITFK
ncbi:MAG: CoA transferase [Bacteroidetes bacterium]|nr:CoA transferase [Bacteroidota bacterium]